MLQFALSILAAVRVFVRSRGDTALELLALRQQVAVLKRKRPRPRLGRLDRLFWIALRELWSRWTEVLVIVRPETVVGWHRAGFRLYWRWRSRPRGGRPKITDEIRGLIRRLAAENPDWGAPKIHGELLKLGFEVSERTISHYLRLVQRRGEGHAEPGACGAEAVAPGDGDIGPASGRPPSSVFLAPGGVGQPASSRPPPYPRRSVVGAERLSPRHDRSLHPPERRPEQPAAGLAVS